MEDGIVEIISGGANVVIFWCFEVFFVGVVGGADETRESSGVEEIERSEESSSVISTDIEGGTAEEEIKCG